MMYAMGGDHDGALEALVAAAAGGDPTAWTALWEEIEPRLLAVVRTRRFLGPLARREDEPRDIVVEVMTRLRADDCRRLRGYVTARSASPNMRFLPWLIVVAKRVSIDYMRAHDEYVDRRHSKNPESAAGKWIGVDALPPDSRMGERVPMTRRGTARELMSYAGHTLPDEQRRALELWIQSEPYDVIAARVGLEDARAAEKAVRAALERLRRRFREDRR